MEKKSLKLVPWTKGNVVSVVATYVVNIIVLALMFIAIVAINGARGKDTVDVFFQTPAVFINFLLLLFLFVAIIVIFFFFEDRNFLRIAANSEMLFLILELSVIICFVSGQYINIYVRPLALSALLVLFLTNSRTAVFINFIFCMITFLFDSFSGATLGFSDYSAVFFMAMGLSSGTLAIYFLKDVYSRIKLFSLSIILSFPILICVALPLVDFGSDSNLAVSLVSAGCSGPLSAVLFMVLLPFFEVLFKKASFFKYAELTDHKSKFIRKMIAQAPGTFNHAIVVSNIAEACATAIEEDALLARTCAYYHDIGKLRRPDFFKENQTDGVNPHDDLTPELSANIIKAHATDGYQLMMKNRMPQIIADVCAQHHGTLPIIYFYDKAKKFTDGEVSLSQYCYPGPKPQTKIAAIIMIADGCEAAARALKDRSRENVYEVVKKIVSDRMQWGQFDECEITLKELNIIINTVVNSLTGVYHSRIEYPKISLEKIEDNKETEKDKE